MTKIKVFLVDDHNLVRNAIKSMIQTQDDFEVVGEAGDGRSGVLDIIKLQPDIVLMDIKMPDINGIEATKLIKKECPNISIIILTVEDNDEMLAETLMAGATGYLLKDTTAEKLFSTIRSVANGGAIIQENMMLKLLTEFRKVKEKSDQIESILTTRETEVLTLVSEGYNNKMISEKLFISEKTVKNHLHNVYEKLDVKDRVQAITKARDKKLI